MNEGPLFLYGNWAAYDELSDNIPLDEALAMRQLENLLRLRSHGVRFDGYLMDALWYAPDGAYRTWRSPHWPVGPDRWLGSCLENDLKPGLWFTANTVFRLDLPAKWADSVDEKGWGLCLFEGGFLEDFMEVLGYWYGRGVRVFKFDFAEFGAVPAAKAGQLEAGEIRSRNVQAFRAALSEFRSGHPEAVLLAYNGFEERDCMDRSDYPPGRYIDPDWLDVFDSLYCGDPRPSDLPQSDFWRSVDIYSDCQVRLFESSGIPLDRIDNCGFMAGDTGTCYWRGKAGWQAMLALSYARGGRIHVAYGDLSLFDDEDARVWAELQRLYAPGMRPGGRSFFGGWPGSGEPHGWLSQSEVGQVTTLLNPSNENASIDTPFGRELLPPGEVRIRSSSAVTTYGLSPDHPEGRLGSVSGDGRQLKVDLPPVTSATRLRLTVRQHDEQGRAIRNWPDGSGKPPFRVVLRDGQAETEMPPMFAKTIWSGMSWWMVDFNLETSEEEHSIEIYSEGKTDGILTAELEILGSGSKTL